MALDSGETRGRVNSVHFKETQITPDHSGEIVVKKLHNNVFEAHIGFLQEKRKYSISITVPHYLGDELCLAENVTNVTIKGFKADSSKTKSVISLEIIVDNEGMVEKVLKFKGGNGHDYTVKMSFTAIGVAKGTPSLKRGVHCIGHEDPDSDVSEMSMDHTST